MGKYTSASEQDLIRALPKEQDAMERCNIIQYLGYSTIATDTAFRVIANSVYDTSPEVRFRVADTISVAHPRNIPGESRASFRRRYIAILELRVSTLDKLRNDSHPLVRERADGSYWSSRQTLEEFYSGER